MKRAKILHKWLRQPPLTHAKKRILSELTDAFLLSLVDRRRKHEDYFERAFKSYKRSQSAKNAQVIKKAELKTM